MKKKILSLFVILVLLVSVSAVFGFFHNSVTGNSIFGKLFSKNIKPSTELTPGAASQIGVACYGREFKLNTGEARSTFKASEIDYDFELLAVDGNEALFKFLGETKTIDEGKNLRFDRGLEVWVRDVWENPTIDGEGYAVLTFCGEKPFCSSSGYGQRFSISAGNTVYVSKDGINTAVTLIAIDANEILLNIGGESHTIDQGKHERFTNGFEIIVDSVVETTGGQGVAVIEVCGANLVSAVASTKTPTIQPTATKKIGTGLTSPIPTSISDPQRCVVWPYPTNYNEKTGNVLCSGVGNRECVAVVDYTGIGSIAMDKITGVRDCRDLVSSGEGIQRIAVCCRFN